MQLQTGETPLGLSDNSHESFGDLNVPQLVQKYKWKDMIDTAQQNTLVKKLLKW